MDLYTDGACSGNPGRGGWAAILVSNDRIVDQCSGNERKTTNNRMELEAVIWGIKMLRSPEDDPVQIFTDSQYVLKGATEWLELWKKRGWVNIRNEPIKNKDLWDQLDTIMQHRSTPLKWVWVKGHADSHFNNEVDKLARQGCKRGSNNC